MLGFNRLDKEFEHFFWEYKGMVAATALKYTKNQALADDLIQDVFLKIYMNFSKIVKLENPKSYIYRIAVNAINDYFRKNSARIQEISITDNLRAELIGNSDNTEREYDREALHSLLAQLITKMPRKRSSVMALRMIEELSFNEIAESLNMSDASARNHYAHGVKELKTLLQGGVL
ncbi:sigma-70 family RNA polymerase sigma factor [bacterium]|nr:sigma-70 family RNA polymerase sigma factor [bacterium]